MSHPAAMKLYADFIWKSPDELIKEADDEAEYCMNLVPCFYRPCHPGS